MDEIRKALKTMTDRELYDLQQLVEQEWKQRFMETLLAETPCIQLKIPNK